MALPLFEGELRAGQTSMQPVPCITCLRRFAGMHFRRTAKSYHARTGGGVLLGRLCAVRWNDVAGMKKRIATKFYSVGSSAKRYGAASIRRRPPRAGQNSIQSAACAMYNSPAWRCDGMHFRRIAKSCHARTGGGVLLGRLCAVRWNNPAGVKEKIAAKLYSVERSAKCYGTASIRRRAPRTGQNPIQLAICAMYNSPAWRCAGMHFRRAAKSCHARTGGGVLLGWLRVMGNKKRRMF